MHAQEDKTVVFDDRAEPEKHKPWLKKSAQSVAQVQQRRPEVEPTFQSRVAGEAILAATAMSRSYTAPAPGVHIGRYLPTPAPIVVSCEVLHKSLIPR